MVRDARPSAAGSGGRSDLEQAAHGEVLGRVGRAGLLARGLVWVVAGGLAALVALGSGGSDPRSSGATGGSAGSGAAAKQATASGALQSLAGGAAGRVLLAVLAVGLAAYALWSAVRLVAGRRESSWGSRAAAGVQALGYGGLAILAARLVLSSSSSSGGGSDQQAQSITARLLGAPVGQVVAVLLGLVVVAVGIGMVVYGVRRKFLENWEEATTPSSARHAAEVLGVVGYGARGLVYCGSGAFVVAAALTADPQKAKGLDGTLAELVQQPFGPWLLGAVAVGFVAYGVLSAVEARYAKV